MNTSLNAASKCYLATFNDAICAFFAVLHFPHPKVKNFKRGHRLVVLPDFQGLGIGHLFSSHIAQMYKDRGFRFIITSNTKSLLRQRQRDPKWIVSRIGRTSAIDLQKSTLTALANTVSSNKLTYSYEYIG